MSEIDNHESLDLSVLVFASATVKKYGDLVEQMRKDGFIPDVFVNTKLDGDSVRIMAESTGLALLQLPAAIESINPDFVISVGDRYETLATAVATSYMNIPLVHTMGGEVTGTIDESVRHAVSKLSHVHFASTRQARNNLVLMGEEPSRVFITGCPRLDIAREAKNMSKDLLQSKVTESGVGDDIDLSKDFLILSQHPVTSEVDESFAQIFNSLKAVERLNMQTIILWPNSDAGSEQISKAIRRWQKEYTRNAIRFYRNLPPEVYLRLMDLTACLVGNSSSALREGSFLGTPAVNIGNRQSGREHGRNILFSEYSTEAIKVAVERQVNHGKFDSDDLYGDGFAGIKMADILANIGDISTQKQLKFSP
jgi:UDP-hydrolysing UDP-N-acetyl-D-glucosamine 2-epimerase